MSVVDPPPMTETEVRTFADLLEDLGNIPPNRILLFPSPGTATEPDEPIPELAPDLAVEVLSESNTRAEMDRKRQEYFRAGTRLVWEVDPRTRTVAVYNSADNPVTLRAADVLDGGSVVPGFSLPLS